MGSSAGLFSGVSFKLTIFSCLGYRQTKSYLTRRDDDFDIVRGIRVFLAIFDAVCSPEVILEAFLDVSLLRDRCTYSGFVNTMSDGS